LFTAAFVLAKCQPIESRYSEDL